MTLDTTIEPAAGDASVTILSLAGELDASNFASLVETVRELHASGTRRLILDLSELTFMASSGLVALHSIVRIMRGEAPADAEAGWDALHAVGHDVSGGAPQTEVGICAPQPAIQRVLDRTGLSRLFVIHPDRASAFAAS
jgi:anti-anti-sigma regulatory factor